LAGLCRLWECDGEDEEDEDEDEEDDKELSPNVGDGRDQAAAV
jgi:hypothetical protein